LVVIVIVFDGMGNNLEGVDSELERSLAPWWEVSVLASSTVSRRSLEESHRFLSQEQQAFSCCFYGFEDRILSWWSMQSVAGFTERGAWRTSVSFPFEWHVILEAGDTIPWSTLHCPHGYRMLMKHYAGIHSCVVSNSVTLLLSWTSHTISFIDRRNSITLVTSSSFVVSNMSGWWILCFFRHFCICVLLSDGCDLWWFYEILNSFSWLA
jgi:hypothetical protein